MTYNEFVQFLARFLWRAGDHEFEGDLDSIIRMGEARLNRDLRIDRMMRVQTAMLNSEDISLPSDYLEMREVHTITDPQPIIYVTPHKLNELRQRSHSRAFLPFYTVTGDRLMFIGPMTPDYMVEVVLTYYAKVPHFKDTDNSWLVNDHLDLYAYACLIYSAPYLRDDERIVVWRSEYEAMLAAANEGELRKKYAGSPLTSHLPGIVR